MDEPRPHYSFQPLERRGLILGLHAGQLSVLTAGGLTAFVIHDATSGFAGMLLAMATLGASAVLALWSRRASPLYVLVLRWFTWAARRPGRTALSGVPLEGHATTVALEPAGRVGAGVGRPTDGPAPRCLPFADRDRRGARRRLPDLTPPGIRLRGDGPVGVVEDLKGRTRAAVIPVAGSPLALSDPGSQARQIGLWHGLLATVGRPGTGVTRLQWLHRSGPGPVPRPTGVDGRGALEGPGPVGPRRARASYSELLEEVATVARHDTAVIVVVPAGSGSGADDGLGRELRLLRGQLSASDLEPGPPLDLDGLRSLIADCYGERPGPTPWPLAVREHWHAVRAGAMWHATYWVCEWPRVEVGPDFMAPLLLAPGRQTMSVLMSPVPVDRAVREVRSARTADLADAQLRMRAGFLTSARRQSEARGVERREAELADGHVEYRFSGYLTVSAPNEEELVTACVAAEHSAQACRLELRRLHGRQAEARQWTLPLGRGLR